MTKRYKVQGSHGKELWEANESLCVYIRRHLVAQCQISELQLLQFVQERENSRGMLAGLVA